MRRVELREFKAITMSKLMKLNEELKQKYPAKASRIDELTDMIVAKLTNLRSYTMSDFLFLIYAASKEFPEFKELFPDPQEVEQLMKED